MNRAQRRRFVELIEQLEGHLVLIRQKTDRKLSAPPLTRERLEDVWEQLATLVQADLNEARSILREAIGARPALPVCAGCGRSEEIVDASGRTRRIRLDKRGQCQACREAEAEARADAQQEAR